MRSHLVAAVLTLAVGVGSALAQSPPSLTTTSDPLAKNDPVTESAAKAPVGKKGGKAAAKSDPAKTDKAPPVPPAAGINAVPAPGGRNVTATGKTMPPAAGRGSGSAAPVKASTEVEMLKAQKAAEERNKSWDAKMRRTMSTICNGC